MALLAGPEALGDRTWGRPGGEAPVGASQEPVGGRFPTDQPGWRDSDASVSPASATAASDDGDSLLSFWFPPVEGLGCLNHRWCPLRSRKVQAKGLQVHEWPSASNALCSISMTQVTGPSDQNSQAAKDSPRGAEARAAARRAEHGERSAGHQPGR